MTLKRNREDFLWPMKDQHDGASSGAPSPDEPPIEAVHSANKVQFYASRPKIHPKLAEGYFRRLKWSVMAITLGIYYLLPWLRWDRGETLPNQAFLLDFAHQRLYFGPIDIWAQEFYLIIGVLVVSALALFLITAIAGRMWCGYTCPQTVWTDLMIAVERFWQGDRAARIRLDKEPWGFNKIWRKTATHVSWLLIGLATGGALVFYFRDAPTLAYELVTGTAPTVAYAFVLIFTVSTYLLGGIAREQVCIYMCPWPRIQGAMLDHDSLLISYRGVRGEPRGPHKKGQAWDDRGDCIDCKACVAVCPMGIDIRDGQQLECIQCALCIDACNQIMTKVGRPQGLVTYATLGNVDRLDAHPREGWRIIRTRTMLYTALIAVASSIMLFALANRDVLEMNVLPDRNPLYVQLSNGSISNGFTVKILNKLEETRHFKLVATGLPGAEIAITGLDRGNEISVVPADLRSLRVHIIMPPDRIADLTEALTSFRLTAIDLADNSETHRELTFRSPQK